MNIFEAIDALALSLDPVTGGIIDIEKFEEAKDAINGMEKIYGEEEEK